jgi:hypothetical protein
MRAHVQREREYHSKQRDTLKNEITNAGGGGGGGEICEKFSNR